MATQTTGRAQALGGQARARSLSPARRTEIAARKRWAERDEAKPGEIAK